MQGGKKNRIVNRSPYRFVLKKNQLIPGPGLKTCVTSKSYALPT